MGLRSNPEVIGVVGLIRSSSELGDAKHDGSRGCGVMEFMLTFWRAFAVVIGRRSFHAVFTGYLIAAEDGRPRLPGRSGQL